MFDDNVGVPKNGSVDTQPLPPVDVPQSQWAAHPILSHGVLNASGDGFDWPAATPDQLEQLREISVVRDGLYVMARLAPQFNFDHFVNATFNEQQAVPPIGRVDDVQRFYTRVTDNGFHVVGVFTAITVNGRRRYFQWLTSTWVEIGQSGFLYVRDDPDTHFSEVAGAQLEQYQPGATTTLVPTPSETWSMEHFEAHFGSFSQNATAADEQVARVATEPPATPTHRDEKPVATIITNAPDPETLDMSIFAPRPHLLPTPDPEMPSERADQPVQITVTEIGAPPPVAAHRTDLPGAVAPAAGTAGECEAEQSIPEHNVATANELIEEETASMTTAPRPTAVTGIPALSESDAKSQQSIASALATIAHRGQLDKVGAAYIDHPARVAERFDWRNEPVHHAAAWLHSVMEDSDITQRDLLEAGIRSEIVDIVALLTRNSEMSDGEFYAAINANPIARAVKLADIADNSAPWRVRRLDAQQQAEFAAKYSAARTALGAAPGE